MQSKQLITDTDMPGNVLGPLIQTGFNAGMMGWEYLRTAFGKVFTPDKRLQESIDAWEVQRQQAIADGDMEKATKTQSQIDRIKNYQASMKTNEARLEAAGQAIDRSWAQVNIAQAKSKAIQAQMTHPLNSPQGKKEFQEIWEQKSKEATMLAESYRNEAAIAYRNGDYQTALTKIELAQENDRMATSLDPYGAYTWVREPERQKKFYEAAAFLELQKGAPLPIEEIRRLKEYYQNSSTEIGSSDFHVRPLGCPRVEREPEED